MINGRASKNRQQELNPLTWRYTAEPLTGLCLFERIGLPGTWTWPAEYPFTGRTLATEPYGKMTPRLPDGHQIFPVFPECPLSPFPPIVFLPGSAGDQFNGIGNCFAIRIISNKQMNVIRCDCICDVMGRILSNHPCNYLQKLRLPWQAMPSSIGRGLLTPDI
jgi:hypothetical protein